MKLAFYRCALGCSVFWLALTINPPLSAAQSDAPACRVLSGFLEFVVSPTFIQDHTVVMQVRNATERHGKRLAQPEWWLDLGADPDRPLDIPRRSPLHLAQTRPSWPWWMPGPWCRTTGARPGALLALPGAITARQQRCHHRRWHMVCAPACGASRRLRPPARRLRLDGRGRHLAAAIQRQGLRAGRLPAVRAGSDPLHLASAATRPTTAFTAPPTAVQPGTRATPAWPGRCVPHVNKIAFSPPMPRITRSTSTRK